MEHLLALGTDIGGSIQGTVKAYTPLLLANAEAIRSTKCETFKYGPHERQELDVYSPSTDLTPSSPLLFFLYGGGLVTGNKTLPHVPSGLVYANVGHFFAEKYGFIVVIPNYRLVPHDAVYPSGGEDIALALEWAGKTLNQGATRHAVIMGNSAGGVHMSTFLFAPEFEDRRAALVKSPLILKGAVELSVPFDFAQARDERLETLKAYYGSDVEGRCPTGLVRALQGTGRTLNGVKLLVVLDALDPVEILATLPPFVDACVEAWKDTAAPLDIWMLEGHNHISPAFSVGTGIAKEEEWGHRVGAWLQNVCA